LPLLSGPYTGSRPSHVVAQRIAAHARVGAPALAEVHQLLAVHREQVLRDLVVAHRPQALAGLGVVQAHLADAVAAPLRAEAQQAVEPRNLVAHRMRALRTENAAPVGLLELVALDRVVQEVGEVGEQVEPVVDGVRAELGVAAGSLVEPLARQADALRLAAVRRVQAAEARQLAAAEEALGHLVGRGPAALVGHAGDAEAARGRALRVAQHGVGFLQVLGHVPGAVVAFELDGAQPGLVGHRARARGQQALEVVRAHRRFGKGRLQRAEVVERGAAGQREVAALRKVRPLAVAHARHQLGHQEVQVGIALPVTVRGHVHRHAVHRHRKVGAVVEVEAAQEVLVGLAVARVLRGDHAGHRLHDVAGAQLGARLVRRALHRALAGAVGGADGGVARADDLDLGQVSLLHGLCGLHGLGAGGGAAEQRPQQPWPRGLAVRKFHGALVSGGCCDGARAGTSVTRKSAGQMQPGPGRARAAALGPFNSTQWNERDAPRRPAA
jgi:hypothetical protein